MEKKKKTNWFKIIFLGLFITYISLYVLNLTGYYEGNTRRKVEFTEEQMKKFEEDIAAGENVNMKDYLKDIEKDYTNNASRLGFMFSKNVDRFLNRGIKDFLTILGKLLS